MIQFISGISPLIQRAEEVLQWCINSGIDESECSVMYVAKYHDVSDKTYPLIYSILGIAYNSLPIPSDIGVLYIGGPLAASLAVTETSRSTGPLVGGIVNACMDIGFPENDAKKIFHAMQHGTVLIGANIEDEKTEEIMKLFSDHEIFPVFAIALEDIFIP